MTKTVSLAVAVLLASTLGCTTAQRVRTETAVAKTLVSDQQEAQLGDQVHQELAKQGVRYVTDPQVNSYVEGIVNRMVPHARRDRDIGWHVYVIDDPKTVNAFATPGGHIYVYTGLLATAANEAELAGVLGHEMGHVVARHSARQMVEAYGLQAVLGMALGQNPGILAMLAATVAGNGAMLANSRSDENEADEYGVKYSSAAGYDPHGIATFFQKLMAQQGRTPKLLTFLSDHPATSDRIAHVDQMIARMGLRPGGDLGAERLAAVKAKLRLQ